MNNLVKVLNGCIVFPDEFVGRPLLPDDPLMYAILRKLAAYEATGYEPEQIQRVIKEAEAASSAEERGLDPHNDLVFLKGTLALKNAPSTAYCETVAISQEEANIINGYINGESAEPQDEDDTIVHTAVFPDGRFMDIKCCGSQDGCSWTEAVLFERNGNELACTEVSEEYLGLWTIEYKGIVYRVDITVQNSPR